MSDVTLRTPRGVRDLLPDEAYGLSVLKQHLTRHFGSWGYDRVVTPTFELLDVMQLVHGTSASQQLYRFVDRDGSMIALRSEMTVPIARLVASRLGDRPSPLRLHYTGPVFRYDEPRADHWREFTQAGVELIGVEGPEADAEIIALTISTMQALGLSGFRMDIGHVGFTASVLDSLGLDAALAKAVRECMLEQNYVGLEAVLKEHGVNGRTVDDLHTLVSLRGDADVLEQAASLARTAGGEAALQNIADVYSLLQDYGVSGWVRLDLGMLKAVDYYSGIVLEGYTPDLGATLCTGGRYDRLVHRFGANVAATGLAIGVERLQLALDRAGVERPARARDFLFVAAAGQRQAACDAAWRMREQGCYVELDIMNMTQDEAVAYADSRGIARVVLFDGSPDGTVGVVEGARTTRCSADDLENLGQVSS